MSEKETRDELLVKTVEAFKELDRDFSSSGKKIMSELEPFLDRLRTRQADYDLFKLAYIDFREKFSQALAQTASIVKEMKFPFVTLGDKLYSLFAYLGLVESLGNTMTDILVMLLVSNDRDLHVESRYSTPHVKHVESIKELEDERIPLATKVNFLRDNGIKEFASIIDCKLRNVIAHLKFQVKDNEIYIRKKPASSFLRTNMRKLVYSTIIVAISILELAEAKGLTKEKKE